MYYKLFGPFDLPIEKQLIVSRSSDQRLKDFWQEVERHHTGLSQATGCYVFSLSASENNSLPDLPCYVGQTSNQNFQKRCVNPRIASMLFRMKRRRGYKTAALKIYFVANMTKGAKKFSFSDTDHKKAETLLIESAAAVNPDLLNTRGKKRFDRLVIEGVVNFDGRLSKSASSFRSLFSVN